MIPNVLIEFITAIIVAAILVFVGYHYESTRWDAANKLTMAQNAIQEAKVAELDKRNQENENVSKIKQASAVAAIDTWYHEHPITITRVQHDSTICAAVSSIIESPKEFDVAATSGVPATSIYIDKYDPIKVEQMASQLDELQKLLIQDGVTIDTNN